MKCRTTNTSDLRVHGACRPLQPLLGTMKRHIFKLCFFLLLGAIINVAMAWGCGWRSEFEANDSAQTAAPKNQRGRAEMEWIRSSTAERRYGCGVERILCSEAFVYDPGGDEKPNWGDDAASVLANWLPTSLTQTWGTASWPTEGELYFAQGWPCRAMWCVFIKGRPKSSSVLLHADSIRYTPQGNPRVLALFPYWPGFAINTIFYAATLWVLFAFMERRILKLAPRILLFLLLGAIINVAVGWGCLLEFPPRWGPMASVDNERDLTPEEVLELLRSCNADVAGSQDEYGKSHSRFGWKTESAAWLPGGAFTWSMLVHKTSAGWPFFATTGCFVWDNPKSGGFAGHLVTGLPMPDWLARGFNIYFPIGVIWPGFAINTIFYAAMLWFPFAAFGRIRRRRRIKRGLCPACAYPVGTSDVCTECGKVVTR